MDLRGHSVYLKPGLDAQPRWRIGALVGLMFAHGLVVAGAADRSLAYLPMEAGTVTTDSASTSVTLSKDDEAILKAGLSPPDAVGLPPGQSVWQEYMALWKRHQQSPSEMMIRRFFRLPAKGLIAISDRRGRIAPRFLRWRTGDFRQIETPHFVLLSRANPEQSRQIAERLELAYWVWTQQFFPLWSGRTQVGLAVERLRSESDPTLVPLQGRQHRVVLLSDAAEYQSTIASSSVSAGSASMIAASAGFYSSELETSFFYPQSDHASLAHELCHQLFFEATDRRRGIDPLKATEAFCWVEGIAGHFESLRFGTRLASVGGWDSSRLQYARYRTLIGSQPIVDPKTLMGTRQQCQARSDIADWYSQSILHTHLMMDDHEENLMPSRVVLLRTLADIYRIEWPAEMEALSTSEVPFDASRATRFLQMDDAKLETHPITNAVTELCLAGTKVTAKGWGLLPGLPRIRWLDASRTPITTAIVRGLVEQPQSLRQLSLEATQIDPSIVAVLSNASELKELDLSWTQIDDAVVSELSRCQQLETLWLTGTPITDNSISMLQRLPHLKTIDIQRTQISESAMSSLKADLGDRVQFNPLDLP